MSSKVETLQMSSIKGYWDKTYEPSKPFSDSTLGIVFSGLADPDQALSESTKVKDMLVGDKYISLGGGIAPGGSFTQQILNSIITHINNGNFSDYSGIAFDIEVGEANLTSLFQQAFAAAKTKNLKVLVTISHSAPYGIPDAQTMMKTFIDDGNIDYLSPQLYTSETETQNDFQTSQGVSWQDYARSKAL